MFCRPESQHDRGLANDLGVRWKLLEERGTPPQAQRNDTINIILRVVESSPCPLGEDTVSFEKVVGLKPSTSRMSPMFAHREGFGAGGLTSDCLRRCQATPHCIGVMVNYEHNACFAASAVGTIAPLGPLGPIHREEPLVQASDRSSYFAKMCMHGPACERDWLMERVPGKELRGFDDRIVSGVPSRHRCQELCLHERSFPCRSGEFDPRSRQCRLSTQDRRTQPDAFKPARVAAVEYFENLCVPATPETCDYELRRDVDLFRADTVRTAFNSDQCRALCDASREFACRSFTFSEANGLCFLSGDDTVSLGGFALKMRPGVGFYQRGHCVDPVQLSCTREAMVLTMNTVDPFRGRVYARADSPPCEVVGSGSKSTTLTLGLLDRKCGITEDEGGRFTTTVVIQHHPMIQQKGDRIIKLFCLFNTGNKTVTNTYKVLVGQSPSRRPGVVNATAPSPNIRMRITDRAGADITGAKLGDELFLRIEIDDDSVFGIFARNLIATSGQNDDSIVLINSAGCPTDNTIFPALQRTEGNKGLHSRFEAFKFADDVVVRFQVTVQFCLHECAPASCDNGGTKSFGRRRRRRREVGPRSTTAAPTAATMLPEYPLQREIIVEGIGGNRMTDGGTATTRNRPTSDAHMVCATPTVVTAAVIAAFLIQLAAIAACVSCIALIRRSWEKQDMEVPVRAARSTVSACSSWNRTLNRV
ncbi:uncharacterized protein LOC135390537 [Ornithodoros turicata]|uniref:uncharacterized protein LOC135390537 n=1 Tax=Ornithodoros turicata TaxID=34597 RepID=UPI00313915D0